MEQNNECRMGQKVHSLGEMVRLLEGSAFGPETAVVSHEAGMYLRKAVAITCAEILSEVTGGGEVKFDMPGEQVKPEPAVEAEVKDTEEKAEDAQPAPKTRKRRAKAESVDVMPAQSLDEGTVEKASVVDIMPEHSLDEGTVEKASVVDDTSAEASETGRAENRKVASVTPEVVFGKGLDPELASLSTLDGVDNDYITKENVSPIVLANSVGKEGNHPFYKGSASFISYLPERRQPLYMLDLLAYTDEYPNPLALYSMRRVEQAKQVGVDMRFVCSPVNMQTRSLYEKRDFGEDEFEDSTDEAFLKTLKERMKLFVETIDPEKKLLKFMRRNHGYNEKFLRDMEDIMEAHTRNPNRYVGW